MTHVKIALAIACLLSIPCSAADKTIVINAINNDGIGNSIGSIRFSDTDDGMLIAPNLGNLSPGPHGFHIHANPDCSPAEKDGKKLAGLAAGSHFDPTKTNHHEGPEGQGHQGDLPALMVNEDGSATRVLVAPRLKVEDIVNRTVIIHEGSDNYSDEPKPLGGGGARIACGVIE